jgi:oligopeptidase B
VVVMSLFLASTFGIDPKAATPPAAKRIPHEYTLHGVKITDDYFWLKDKKNADVIAFLNAENVYREAVMKPSEALQKKLYDEFISRMKETDLTVPYREGSYWYLSKTFKGKQYPTYVRRKGSVDGPEEVILDVNKLAEGKKFASARPVDISDDERFMIFTSDFTGYREYYLSIVDLSNGSVIQDQFVKGNGNAVWAADNRTILYVTEDESKRPFRLWRHTVGEPKEKDALLYEEKIEQFNLGVQRSRDKKQLFFGSASSNTTEIWHLAADNPTGKFQSILGRKEGREYTADHREDKFYIRTNDGGAVNFKVESYAVGSTTPEADFVPYNPNVFVEEIELFKDYAVVEEREGGVPQLRVIDFATKESRRIAFPEPIYTAGLGNNPEYDQTKVQITYSSFVTPDSVYEYDLKTNERTLLKQKEIPAGHKPEDYAVERITATSADGAKVPVSILTKKGIPRDGTAACLLYGYGSYGATTDVDFDPTVLSLLDRGVVFAVGHIRGSADLGRTWYDDGKMMKKRNTFSDFAACADALVAEKFCSRDRLAIQGGSAGGLLVGATINLRPDLCKAAVLEVPFLDVVNTMLDETLPLTTQEFLEWGNPKLPNEFAYLRSYCPYTNIQKTKYPMMMVTTSLNDSQVAYHEPAKYVAKMRAVNPDATILFKCNMEAGHGGASGRYDNLKERAMVMAFVLEAVGAGK